MPGYISLARACEGHSDEGPCDDFEIGLLKADLMGIRPNGTNKSFELRARKTIVGKVLLYVLKR